MDSRSHILVIEDDVGVGTAIEGWLRAAGLHVHVAGSAEDGLALLEGITPDAVLLDLWLPARGGRQVLAALRAHGWPGNRRDAIRAAPERTAGSRAGASREPGISRATLYRKLKEQGIE